MNEHLKLYGKIALKSTGILLLVAGLGTIITIITFLTCFIASLFLMEGSAGTGHNSPGALIDYVVIFATKDPCGFAVVFGGPFFLTGYFMLAGKIAIQNALYLVWKNKGVQYFEPVIGRIAKRVVTQRMNEKFNHARLRAGLRDVNRNDPTTKPVQKKVINYALKKVKLDNIDHSQEELTIDEIITKRTVRFISDMAEPGYVLFWILVALQIVLTIVSVKFF